MAQTNRHTHRQTGNYMTESAQWGQFSENYLGPGSGAGGRADCCLPGGGLVNWVPFCDLKAFL